MPSTVRIIYLARGLRGFGDGFATIVLPVLSLLVFDLTHLGRARAARRRASARRSIAPMRRVAVLQLRWRNHAPPVMKTVIKGFVDTEGASHQTQGDAKRIEPHIGFGRES
jgi:hypothetical protein